MSERTDTSDDVIHLGTLERRDRRSRTDGMPLSMAADHRCPRIAVGAV